MEVILVYLPIRYPIKHQQERLANQSAISAITDSETILLCSPCRLKKFSLTQHRIAVRRMYHWCGTCIPISQTL